MITYTAQEGQNLFDIALQLYGSVEALRQLIFDNPQIATANFTVFAGDIFMIDDTKIVDYNKEIAEYYAQNSYIVTTNEDISPFAEFSDDFSTDFNI